MPSNKWLMGIIATLISAACIGWVGSVEHVKSQVQNIGIELAHIEDQLDTIQAILEENHGRQ